MADTQHMIKAENDIEKAICEDPAWIEGSKWGKARPGHPEGAVENHINEVLENIDHLEGISDVERSQLRLIALVHDTFKNKVDTKKSRSGENHHAMIARRFTQGYTTDTNILDIIELHDEAYNAYCLGSRDKKWEKAKARAHKLVERLGENLELYILFYEVDNATGDKSSASIEWFLDFCNCHYSEPITISEQDYTWLLARLDKPLLNKPNLVRLLRTRSALDT